MGSDEPRMIYQFCLEIRAINGPRHALILGFSRSRATYEVVNLETGELTEPQTCFCITPDIYDEYFLQLSAYKQALFEMEKIDAGMGIILLSTGTDGKGTGKYKFQENDYYFDEFMAARKLWIWKSKQRVFTKLLN